MTLTTRQINELSPKSKRYTVSDTHGLCLRVHPTGSKSWVLRISFQGRVSDVTLGQYPEVSLKEARQRARRKRKEVGLDAPNGYVLRDAFKLWCGLKRGRIVSYKDEKRRLETYLIKPLGGRQLDEITAPLVIYTVKKLANEGKLPTLKRILMRGREIMDLAVCAGFISHNPIDRVSRIFPTPKTKPMLSVQWTELPWVMSIMKNADLGTRRLFLFSCLSALRPIENAKLEWKWIGENDLTIPADEMKKGREHRVPLTWQMRKVLEGCRDDGRVKYVFYNPRTGRHISGQKLAKYFHSTELRGKLVAHGLRSIARSWMADHGVRFEVAEACLSHLVGSQVSRAYQRSDYFDARCDAMRAWNDYVWDCAEKAGVLEGIA